MAKREQQELSDDAVTRIQSVVRSMQDDHVERGVSLSGPMRCDSCGQEKTSAGSAQYGAYKLCNDCLLDFTLALASSKVASVADFMTTRPDGTAPSAQDESEAHYDRSSVSFNRGLAREKLMPSNEPC